MHGQCKHPAMALPIGTHTHTGPQYRVLGAVVWGPLCGVAHVLNDLVKPRYWIEDLLVSSNLLNPVVLGARGRAVLTGALSGIDSWCQGHGEGEEQQLTGVSSYDG